jgi:hypothetical protein
MRVGAMVAVVLVVLAVPVGTPSSAVAGPLPAVPTTAIVSAGSLTSPVWTKLTPASSPSARDSSLSAFDPATGQIVLYGGMGGFFPGTLAVDNSTWTFDGASWSKHVTSITPGSQLLPDSRLAYDPVSKKLVLFAANGTWTWNGSQWTIQHPVQVPSLFKSCMATDAAAGELVLFGEHVVVANTGKTVSWQTWAWRGGNWVQLPEAVSPQGPDAQVCEMTYDEANQDLVLVTASWYAGEFSGASPGETWTFDGTTWTQRETLTNTTGGVDFSSMTYDPAYGQVMTYGGFDVSHGNAVLTNPWSWNGSTWQQVTLSPAPPARVLAAERYDAATGQLVVFGGVGSTSYLGDTWVLSTRRSSSVTPTRLSGADRQSTAVAVSASAFSGTGSASAVVLARADQFADALAGGPLAAAKHAPLLLTSSGSLDAVTAAEIQRVLPKGGTVYLLGGTSALSDAVANAITAMGDVPTRIAGADRYATAVAIAAVMGNPTTVFEASGVNFPDALSAVPAAVAMHGAILLTNGSAQTAATSAYLTAHATSRYAVGGPAAYADPSAIGIAGADRYATSDAVALALFPTTTGVSVASGANFPDALAAGPVAGAANQPVLLLPSTGTLPEPITSYLTTHAGGITSMRAFGGTTAVADAVLSEVAQSVAAG